MHLFSYLDVRALVIKRHMVSLVKCCAKTMLAQTPNK